jgi:hypothetical protein
MRGLYAERDGQTGCVGYGGERPLVNSRIAVADSGYDATSIPSAHSGDVCAVDAGDEKR